MFWKGEQGFGLPNSLLHVEVSHLRVTGLVWTVAKAYDIEQTDLEGKLGYFKLTFYID